MEKKFIKESFTRGGSVVFDSRHERQEKEIISRQRWFWNCHLIGI